ncbi:hypothetical protein [Nocardioides sp.]|uniref:hypothetical protein n=1 Tax=Nocardioides sp. TaxID=35761 RepID=UPI0027330711|nr:hypothetical protein [Nocardioides sp.]MDP3892383.1 hypothetical protein [Nocardioides sp.]
MSGPSLGVLPSLAAAVVLTAGAVAGGVALTGREESAAPEAPAANLPPLASYDTTGATAERAAFCDRLPDTAVAAALGAAPSDTAHYDNGEPADLTDGVSDVSHEFGCTFRSADGSEARAWIFAPPVTTPRAEQLAAAVGRSAREAADCSVVDDAATIGQVPVATLCRTPQRVAATYHGLVGDAWLSCSLSLTGPETHDADPLLERAGDWCVQVLEATRTG